MYDPLESTAVLGSVGLRTEDPTLYALLHREMQRQEETLSLVASSGGTDPSVMAVTAASLVNLTAEGYPGARYHAGCAVYDEIEQLAIDRAKALFGAAYANVQPHCASSANHIVMHAVLQPGDTVLGMALEEGGHLTHGADVNLSGRLYRVVRYGLDPAGYIDFDGVERLARACRPKLIVCGTTAYPRTVDFERFRAIADEVGALLLADVTHVAGLVAAGLHPSPIDAAHFTTLCTFKQLYGPRGGLILMGRDHDRPAPDGRQTLSAAIQKAVFPAVQGSPAVNIIPAKALAFELLMQPAFKLRAQAIVRNAQALADALSQCGYAVCSGGTDNHMVLIRLPEPLTGIIAQQALERAGVMINKNKVPGDPRSSLVTSGMRLGTNTVALRGMGPAEMQACAAIIDEVLRAVSVRGEKSFQLDDEVTAAARRRVQTLCARFPLPYAPVAAHPLLPVAQPAFAG